jgi:hypothetical protein
MTRAASDISASLRAEATRLRAQAAELDGLAAILEGDIPLDGDGMLSNSTPAPYGYRADGTPRRRPGRRPQALTS